MKKILIVGKDSYIGESLKKWLDNYPEKYFVRIVSPLDGVWKEENFSQYQVVVDFAGIAHINNIKEDMRELFYSVNRDLSYEIAKFAKEQGVQHFIISSSMNVYGDYCDNLVNRYDEKPTSFYGDSKLQGDIKIRELEDEDFVVSYLRPPFVYGYGCRGNYNTISKIAKKTPVFPSYKNKKSMIYIDNLCEFIRLCIDEQLGGILTPQNKELISTSYLVEVIAKVNNKKIWFTKVFNWSIAVACKFSKRFRSAFFNDCYSLELSDYFEYKYCVVDFYKSICITEGIE